MNKGRVETGAQYADLWHASVQGYGRGNTGVQPDHLGALHQETDEFFHCLPSYFTNPQNNLQSTLQPSDLHKAKDPLERHTNTFIILCVPHQLRETLQIHIFFFLRRQKICLKFISIFMKHHLYNREHTTLFQGV